LNKTQDYYFKKAKKEHYWARSVYKLEEIDRKYRLVKPGFHVLDIGCAPGSWSQYLLKKIGSGWIVGIDIRDEVKVSDRRFTFVSANLLHMESPFLNEYMGTFDLITSDAAPNTSGNKFLDSQSSLDMVRSVFWTAGHVLKTRGCVVAKIFQGEDVHAFIQKLKKEYERVHLHKPASSRKESKELFIIALHRRVIDDTKR